jgi:hypothetical protein
MRPRFRPPLLPPRSEIDWLLSRAFGPPGAPLPPLRSTPAIDPAAALALARRFELAPRLALRQGRSRLEAELGREIAGAFVRERQRAAAEGLRLLAARDAVLEAAAGLRLPVVLLKFAALEATGAAPLGGRSACDIDVLAPPEGAATLHRALAGRGFAASPSSGYEHQLPALAHPLYGAVEIHRLVPGVRPGGGRKSATVATLAAAGLLVPLPALPGEAAAPAPAVLAAHLLVHGLVQHGYWPESYSLLKMMGDLIDLGLGRSAELATAAAALIVRDVDPAEVAATALLCGGLSAARAPAPPDPAGLLLAHALAGRLDRGYEQALRLGVFRPQPSDRPEPLRLLRALAGTVFLSHAQVDAIYGPPAGPLGYLGRQIARPFDLAGRLATYTARRLRLGRSS